jgi:AcrR family transcriptional regulator
VVEVARDILRSYGLAGLQARKVAEGSGCSVGTIYNMYGNLDAVIITANTETLAELREALLKVRNSGTNLAERLEVLAMAYLDFAVERNHEWRAVFEHRLANKTVVPDCYRQSQAELFAIVEEILAPAVTNPELRREAARALFAAVNGIISLALDEKLHAFDRAATERQIHFVISAVAAGLETGQVTAAGL